MKNYTIQLKVNDTDKLILDLNKIIFVFKYPLTRSLSVLFNDNTEKKILFNNRTNLNNAYSALILKVDIHKLWNFSIIDRNK